MRTLISARARNHDLLAHSTARCDRRLALVVACLGLAACGDTMPSRAKVFAPDSAYDPDGDGIPNGHYRDTDGDGISDGIDTDDNGTVDVDVYGQPFKNGDGDDDKPNGDDDDTTTGDGDENCQEQIVRNDRLAPDMLIVLDRSGSMKKGSVNRWDPSVMAVKAVTAQLGGGISFGLMSFPQRDDDCGAGELDVKIAANNGAAIATALTNMSPGGNTP